MKDERTYLLPVSIIVLVMFLFWQGFSDFNLKGQYQKSIEQKLSIQDLNGFQLDVHNGSVKLVGNPDVTECIFNARLLVKAETDEEAHLIAENDIHVQLVPKNGRIVLDVVQPDKKEKPFKLNLDCELILPAAFNTDLKLHNGSINISSLSGSLKAQTHNGSVQGDRLDGNIEFETHNGKVELRNSRGIFNLATHNSNVNAEEIDGSVRAQTHNGSVRISYKTGVAPEIQAHCTTHNGNVWFDGPESLSAHVEARTRNGMVHNSTKMNIHRMHQKMVSGKAGNGKGRIYLETHNGSIHLH